MREQSKASQKGMQSHGRLSSTQRGRTRGRSYEANWEITTHNVLSGRSRAWSKRTAVCREINAFDVYPWSCYGSCYNSSCTLSVMATVARTRLLLPNRNVCVLNTKCRPHAPPSSRKNAPSMPSAPSSRRWSFERFRLNAHKRQVEHCVILIRRGILQKQFEGHVSMELGNERSLCFDLHRSDDKGTSWRLGLRVDQKSPVQISWSLML